MLRNQNHLEEEAKKAYAEINTLVAGMTLQSSMSSTSWQKDTKGLVDAMKKTDSALDEWMPQLYNAGLVVACSAETDTQKVN